ncbi:hypothetical protein BLA24_16300 [Streptomyces cinnamoneus]|uniref:Uncharacterized protein n=1 Tax=Streptomyces cinnamoneus TaxID=53446 RepID=A0A2G1XJC1_STRCJ|nr:hypothetical protein [Streptomyces cinnamoneus]PHQ51300.1 hypothetical protein BLA24_16300 [Streptomyces cinnamoneus]PPT13474.1 hypothetical protein CYQ11_11775 [Streptomyces cinnamoneus]
MREDESGFEVSQQQGGWVVRMWWPTGPVTGGPQRITVEAADDASARDVVRGISTTVLRRLDIAAAMNAAKMAPEAQRTLEDVTRKLDESGEAAGALLADEGVSERYLAMLAATYKGMADTGAPAPVPWLARLIDRRPETIKDHLKKARRDGYLSTLAGKAGGDLTEKAKAVLDSMASAAS